MGWEGIRGDGGVGDVGGAGVAAVKVVLVRVGLSDRHTHTIFSPSFLVYIITSYHDILPNVIR